MEVLCTKYQPPLSFKTLHVAFVYFMETFNGTIH